MLWIDPERQAFVVLVVGRARPGGGAEEAASSIVRSAVAALDGAAR
jgi:hypothetical protein